MAKFGAVSPELGLHGIDAITNVCRERRGFRSDELAVWIKQIASHPFHCERRDIRGGCSIAIRNRPLIYPHRASTVIDNKPDDKVSPSRVIAKFITMSMLAWELRTYVCGNAGRRPRAAMSWLSALSKIELLLLIVSVVIFVLGLLLLLYVEL